MRPSPTVVCWPISPSLLCQGPLKNTQHMLREVLSSTLRRRNLVGKGQPTCSRVSDMNFAHGETKLGMRQLTWTKQPRRYYCKRISEGLVARGDKKGENLVYYSVHFGFPPSTPTHQRSAVCTFLWCSEPRGCFVFFLFQRATKQTAGI